MSFVMGAGEARPSNPWLLVIIQISLGLYSTLNTALFYMEMFMLVIEMFIAYLDKYESLFLKTSNSVLPAY
jgi:hypothetical protein